MTIQVYYGVFAKTQHEGKPSNQDLVGYYANELLAEQVAEKAREIFGKHFSEPNLSVSVESYQDEVIICPAGVRLKNTPGGAIHLIQNELDVGGIDGLALWRFRS